MYLEGQWAWTGISTHECVHTYFQWGYSLICAEGTLGKCERS